MHTHTHSHEEPENLVLVYGCTHRYACVSEWVAALTRGGGKLVMSFVWMHWQAKVYACTFQLEESTHLHQNRTHIIGDRILDLPKEQFGIREYIFFAPA